MTEPLFRFDAYLTDADAVVVHITEEGGVVLDRSIFYAAAGGQPGDSGELIWEAGAIGIATAVKGQGDDIVLVPSEPAPLPAPGTVVTQRLDWTRRHRHMRIHTALHLLSAILPFPVTGGQIGAEKGRLDFAMEEPIADKEALEARLNALIDQDYVVSDAWITDEELAANPGLVKTMSAKPPMGRGKVRLVRIGPLGHEVDLQPCGGTHVARTCEIGRIRMGKIEKKGRMNRRVSIHLD